MKSIKFILLCSIVLQTGAGPLEQVAKKGLKAAAQEIGTQINTTGIQVAESLSKTMVDTAPSLGREGLESVAQMLPEASKNIALEGAKELAKSADKIIAVADKAVVTIGAIMVAKQLYDVGKDVVSYACPSQEHQMKENKAREYNQKLKAKKEFRNCLIKNHSCSRNEFGRPKECEQAAQMLCMMKGKNALDKMTERFTQAYGK